MCPNPHRNKKTILQREKGELICCYLLFCKFLAAAPEVLVFSDLSLGGWSSAKKPFLESCGNSFNECWLIVSGRIICTR